MNPEFNFQWHITNLCNLRCAHCYQHSFTNQTDLPWPQLQSVADNIIASLKSWNKVTRINITGGEPLLNKDLMPLLEYLDISPQVKELTIITNATLINKSWAEETKRISKLNKIKVSLEGASPATNDAVRGEGVFNKVSDNLAVLKENSKANITVMFTLMKSNIKEISRMFDFCKKEGLSGLILERFIPQGQGSKIKEEVLDSKDWKEAVELILDFCSLGFNEKEMFPYKAFWVDFDNGSPLKLSGAACNVADQSLCIMPNGTVLPCRRFNLPIGNLLNGSLKEIWENTPLLKEVRDKTKLKGKCGACDIKGCAGCRALAYSLTGNYLEEDCQCWYSPKKVRSTEYSVPSKNK